MKFSPADRQKLIPLLEQLCLSVEDLLLTGLTTVSDSTRQTLNVTFQETSRMGLLRLGSTLRFANEELGRYARHDSDFSKKRLAFFLNRAWLLAQGLARALRENNDQEFEKLLWMPPATQVKELKFVVLGVLKRSSGRVPNFEFRLRLIEATDTMPAGQPLTWSYLPIPVGPDVPLDGYLVLDQRQKFAPIDFLSGKCITVQNAAVTLDKAGTGRVTFTEQTKVSIGAPFTHWCQYTFWNTDRAVEKIRAHRITPLDLDTDLQEEVFLTDWTVHAEREYSESQIVFPISRNTLFLSAVASKNIDGSQLTNALRALKDVYSGDILYGLLHYERCQLIIQPLTVFSKDGPDYLMITKEPMDKQKLVKSMKFT